MHVTCFSNVCYSSFKKQPKPRFLTKNKWADRLDVSASIEMHGGRENRNVYQTNGKFDTTFTAIIALQVFLSIVWHYSVDD